MVVVVVDTLAGGGGFLALHEVGTGAFVVVD